jgi:hypothetical protein
MQENKVAIINKSKEDGLAVQVSGKVVYRLVHDENLNHHAALTILDNKGYKFTVRHADGDAFRASDSETDAKLLSLINSGGEFEGTLIVFKELDREGAFKKGIRFSGKIDVTELGGATLVALAGDPYAAAALEAIFTGYLWTISKWEGHLVENADGAIISPMVGGKPTWGESLDLQRLFEETKKYRSLFR